MCGGGWPDVVFYFTRAQNANFQNSRCENTPLIGRESPPPSVSPSHTSNRFEIRVCSRRVFIGGFHVCLSPKDFWVRA